MRHLVRQRIDPDRLRLEVSDPGCGATILFLGTVRDENDGRSVTGIEYTAYEPMAERELRRIVTAVEGGHPGVRMAVEHRLGELVVGEVSLAIAIAHPRSAPPLDALREALHAVKSCVPIWKREHYVDGTRRWVAAGGGSAAQDLAATGRRPEQGDG